MNNWVQIIVSILSGLAVCIPLATKLVQYVQKAVKEKNWSAIVALVFDYMKQAESMTANGAAKKEWVMGMVKQSAATINYSLDEDAVNKISALIDSACDMAKTVNAEG